MNSVCRKKFAPDYLSAESLPAILLWGLLSSGLLPAISVAQIIDFNPATTIQLPTFGVTVNPDGVLEHAQFSPPGGQLFRQRAEAARARLDTDIQRPSQLRKVSLARLQKTILEYHRQGQELPDDILKLAGLLRVQYVFAYPDQNDIVIAGPAQGWIEEPGGRAVGMTTGRPVVLLEDLLTALRVFTIDKPNDIWVGCSIGSTAAGMERLKELQRKMPRRVPPEQEQAIAAGIVPLIEEALGNAGVSVFGVRGETNMARVMIEADYRMKLIGIGREPPPVRIPVFFDKLAGAPRNNYQRWWFTPNYRCIRMTGDRLALHMAGQGVQLGTEEYKTDEQGRLIQLQTKPLRAARLYAEAFTDKYDQIAAASPVFAQLRNMVDVLMVASYIQREDLLAKTGMSIDGLLDSAVFSVETRTTPVEAKCLANAHWKSGRLIAPSGGVSILASHAFQPQNLLPSDDGEIRRLAESSPMPADPAKWWWD